MLFDYLILVDKPVATVFTTVVAVYAATCVISFRQNYVKAKATGLPIVFVPCYTIGVPWLVIQQLLLPLLSRFPKAWTDPWLQLLDMTGYWHCSYGPFAAVGADTLVAVSPGGIIIHTCEPETVTQLFRDTSFEKPPEIVDVLYIYGPTITGSNAEAAALYRRTTAPFFSEDTLRAVFKHTVESAVCLGRICLRQDSYRHIRALTARLSLSVVVELCFEKDTNVPEILAEKETNPTNHRLSLYESMHGLLENFPSIATLPRWFLRWSPFRAHRHASRSLDELGIYINETYVEKQKQLNDLSYSPQLSVLGQLINRSGEDVADRDIDLIVRQPTKASKSSTRAIEVNEILGNIFVFMFAGHEANAGGLVAVILLLACFPDIQRQLQAELDSHFQRRPIDDWNYDRDAKFLLKGFCGAISNEALRLFTVLPYLPKCVPPHSEPVLLTSNHFSHAIPPDTLIFIHVAAAHQHPISWPIRDRPGKAEEGITKKRNRYTKPSALSAFDPNRWLGTSYDADGLEKPFQPSPGTYMPFSGGARSCPGKRFGEVELCTAVAVLFRQYSVELITNEWEGQTEEQKTQAWHTARNKAEESLFSGIKFAMSVRLVDEIPFRFRERK